MRFLVKGAGKGAISLQANSGRGCVSLLRACSQVSPGHTFSLSDVERRVMLCVNDGPLSASGCDQGLP
jgi:hypothetical protein